MGQDALDGDTLRTADGGEWRLAGVLAPKRSDGARRMRWDAPPDDRAGVPHGSPADAARGALAVLISDRPLWMTVLEGTPDRYQRRLAVVRDATCRPLAEQLLAAGHARVYPTFATRALAAALYDAEAPARRALRGLWADARYRVLEPAETAGRADSYVVVEGRPVAAADTRSGTVLLFGADRRRDFAVVVPAGVRRLMQGAGSAPQTLVGRQVRVRGWLRYRAGAPVIELAVPEQLEVAEP